MTTWATRPGHADHAYADVSHTDFQQGDLRPGSAVPAALRTAPERAGEDELSALRDLARARKNGDLPDVRLVVVSMGTDHHRFERLSVWVERWLETAGPDVVVIVQHGTTRRPQATFGFEMLRHADLLRFMRAADAVITQGGPGGIMDSRAQGRLPIVVPRSAQLQEHVDDHQQAFAKQMSQVGRIALATDEQGFRETLDRALSEPQEFLASDDTTHIAETVARFGDLVDAMMTPPVRSPRRFRRLLAG